MNPMVTSKEEILAASKKLMMEQGWAAVNIRSVAAACGVAVGSIYNYYQSKADLVGAAVESVWREIFPISESELTSKSFLECVEWFFQSMEKGSRDYPGVFTLHSMGFLGGDKAKGQQLMRKSWEHIKQNLYIVLVNDRNVRPGALQEPLTPEAFIEMIFSLLVSSMIKGEYDSAPIAELIRRSIYSP